MVLVFALFMLRKVHQIYRATGATFSKAMTEGQSTIGTSLWSNETVRNAAQQAAGQAAQHAAQVKKIIFCGSKIPIEYMTAGLKIRQNLIKK